MKGKVGDGRVGRVVGKLGGKGGRSGVVCVGLVESEREQKDNCFLSSFFGQQSQNQETEFLFFLFV